MDTTTSPKDVLLAWVDAFNNADAEAVSALYHDDGVNHQVALDPVVGRDAIRQVMSDDFARRTMTCVVENMFEDGDWAMLEWSDPIGLRGCGFFHVVDGKIAAQRGYWDRQTARESANTDG